MIKFSVSEFSHENGAITLCFEYTTILDSSKSYYEVCFERPQGEPYAVEWNDFMNSMADMWSSPLYKHRRFATYDFITQFEDVITESNGTKVLKLTYVVQPIIGEPLILVYD